MGKVAKKKLYIWTIGIAVTLVLGTLAYFLIDTNQSSNQSTEESETSTTTTYFINENVHEDIASQLREILNDLEIKQTNKAEKATIKIDASLNFNESNEDESLDSANNSESHTFNLYQIWILTKSWKKLSQQTPNVISSCSPKINCDYAESLIPKSLQLNFNHDQKTEESDQANLKLETLEELDGNRISIPVNDFSALDSKSWEKNSYPLIYTLSFSSSNENIIKEIETIIIKNEALFSIFQTELPKAEEFVSIAKTGTSVTGGPGWYYCERTYGLEHPILDVKDFLTEADYAIVSNETSFIDGCTQESGTMAFCGKPSYLQNLLKTEVDIISLTGNHMADYGKTSFQNTMEIYAEKNIKYYGAGKNIEEAWEPLIIETPAGKIGFIGFNKMGPGGVLAGVTSPGTAFYDSEKFQNSLTRANELSDIVWVDTHLWPEYGTVPTNEQITLSQEAIDGGADIVTGVSSHEIQAMTFYKSKPIFYGLGNFWFDQILNENTRLGFALEVKLYQGKIRNIKIIPIRMHDSCQVRLLKNERKQEILLYLNEISQF